MPLLGGVRPPIAALLCLLLAVAGFTALGLGTIRGQQVPQAVRDEEGRIAADTAVSVRTSLTAQATTLRRTAAAYAPTTRSTPATVVKSLLPTRGSVRGGALLDPKTGSVLAATGEAVPLTGVDVAAMAGSGTDAIPPRLVSSGNGGPRLLLFAFVTLPSGGQTQDANQDQGQDLTQSQSRKQWLLAASETLTAPPVHGAGRTAQLVDRDGNVLATTAPSTAPLPGDGGRSLAAAAAGSADAQAAGASGTLLGGTAGGQRTVAGWASVAQAGGTGDTAELGLTVLTSAAVPLTADTTGYGRFALVAAAALAGIAVLVCLLLWATVQRPVLRLHLSAARLARGIQGGPEAEDELARPVPVPAFGEPARIGRALESVRQQLLGEAGPQEPLTRRGPGTRCVVVVCTLLVAAWAGPMLFVDNRADPATAVPATVVTDQQARTEAAADRVRQSLDASSTDLTDVASLIAGKSPADERRTLRRTLTDHRQFRSLYLLDGTGKILLRVGETPLRTLVHAPTGSGITRVNTSGRIPAIAAYSRIPRVKGSGAAAVLFGEIDVKALDSLLPAPGLGSVWLADDHHKVLAASVGFRAFQALPASGFTRLAADSEGAPGTAGIAVSAVLPTGASASSGPSVAAAAPLALTGPAAGLGWRVVAAEPAQALNLTAYQAQWRTMLAGLLALALGVACLAWLHIVVIRPLRALTRLAERLAGGDRRTVLYPVNHDETGSVTRGLELLRQALAERERLGGQARVHIPAQVSRAETAQWR
ncbi:HAMP domain-containing protein [Streptomyces sp. RB6PN25]|uniref:HAMP domain-containing protein n=1 Tax=Streptomyces humicola TaxID=2953240 RepID=A0ABT1PPD8_9ACTN|nr:HAMP domain-containing protein [Streptomyces humicola]MCQ4079539.1 HAMP domain-containing protein [Streptomyces humicola]